MSSSAYAIEKQKNVYYTCASNREKRLQETKGGHQNGKNQKPVLSVRNSFLRSAERSSFCLRQHQLLSYGLSAQGPRSIEPVQQVRMISTISSGIVKWLLNSGAISQQDKELYEYAAYSFLFSLMPLCLVAVLGCIMGVLIEGILMILPFMLIRKFSGGFHLQSPGICLVSSTLLLSVFLFIMRLVIDEQQMILFTCFVIASAIQIFLCSPIDNDARKLNEKQRLVFRKIARIMSTMFLVVYIILLLLGQLRFSVPVGAGILLTALLQVPCFFTKKHFSD